MAWCVASDVDHDEDQGRPKVCVCHLSVHATLEVCLSRVKNGQKELAARLAGLERDLNMLREFEKAKAVTVNDVGHPARCGFSVYRATGTRSLQQLW